MMLSSSSCIANQDLSEIRLFQRTHNQKMWCLAPDSRCRRTSTKDSEGSMTSRKKVAFGTIAPDVAFHLASLRPGVLPGSSVSFHVGLRQGWQQYCRWWELELICESAQQSCWSSVGAECPEAVSLCCKKHTLISAS